MSEILPTMGPIVRLGSGLDKRSSDISGGLAATALHARRSEHRTRCVLLPVIRRCRLSLARIPAWPAIGARTQSSRP